MLIVVIEGIIMLIKWVEIYFLCSVTDIAICESSVPQL